MLRIYFPDRRGDYGIVPLALGCGIGYNEMPMVARLIREGPAHWQASDLATADLAAYPNLYDASPAAHGLARQARDAGLPCLFFDFSDRHDVYHPPHGLVFRSAVYSDRLTPVDRVMPALCDDMLNYCDGRLAFREKAAKPMVGFCGYVSSWVKQAVRALRGDHEKATGHRVRRRAMSSLSRSGLVQTDFIALRQYYGGAHAAKGDRTVVQKLRDQFVRNMLNNDYTLCVRGAGNFSIRFYETLSAGRIPILINTRCALPFADRIDWKKHCVIVEESELHRAGEIVAGFHSRLSPQQFCDLQADNRRLWEEWLEPFSFLQRALADVLADHRSS
jgi:hypothetical protein